MPPHTVGDTVFVEGWSIDKGFSLTECVVESKSNGTLRLRRVKKHERGGTVADSGFFEAMPEAYFATPLQDRCSRLMIEIEAMVRQFDA